MINNRQISWKLEDFGGSCKQDEGPDTCDIFPTDAKLSAGSTKDLFPQAAHNTAVCQESG